jgi:hypothetical protein
VPGAAGSSSSCELRVAYRDLSQAPAGSAAASLRDLLRGARLETFVAAFEREGYARAPQLLLLDQVVHPRHMRRHGPPRPSTLRSPSWQAAVSKLAAVAGMRGGQAVRLVRHLFRRDSFYAAYRRQLATS